MTSANELTHELEKREIRLGIQKDGVKIGIQTKCYHNSVGNSSVQEVIAGKAFYRLDKTIVISNNFFTNFAINLAKSNDVILWDRTILKEKINQINN